MRSQKPICAPPPLKRLWTSNPWRVLKWVPPLCLDSIVGPLRFLVCVRIRNPPHALWGLLLATLVTRGLNGCQTKESALKADTGGEKCPAAPAGDQTRDLPITSPALYHWAASSPRVNGQSCLTRSLPPGRHNYGIREKLLSIGYMNIVQSLAGRLTFHVLLIHGENFSDECLWPAWSLDVLRIHSWR